VECELNGQLARPTTACGSFIEQALAPPDSTKLIPSPAEQPAIIRLT
jgi:hypothetical protein